MEMIDSVESFSGYFFVSQVADDLYINLMDFGNDKPAPEKWEPKNVASYAIIGYRILDGQLQLISLQQEFLKLAISKKQIKGEVIEEEVPSDKLFEELELFDKEDTPAHPKDLTSVDMRLTASTAELRAFFKQHREKILSKEFETLEKQKSPARKQ